MIRVGLVGLGYWGPNLARNFDNLADLTWLCDLDEEHHTPFAARYPRARVTADYAELLADPGLDAVVIATPVPTHYALAKEALEAGKHVLVEKPPAMKGSEMDELVVLAAERDLVLMPGHLLLYHPGVLKLKQLIDAGELGEVLYACAERVNLGIVRDAENAWWSLAAHDVAVAIHLFGATPVSVSATGAAYLRREIADVAFATLRFADGRTAHVHVSWLDPHKRRSLTVVGSRKMLTFDDTAADEKIKIYDKGAVPRPGHTSFEEGVAVRVGDVVSPFVANREPLVAECEHFVAAVATGSRPRSDGRQGLAVVRVLEAGDASIRAGGAPVAVAAGAHGEGELNRDGAGPRGDDGRARG